MRCGGRVNAATVIAAAFVVCRVGLSTSPARAGDDGAHFLLFSGADLWRDGRFMHGGLLWSPEGIDREGFTLEAMISGGTYRYASGALNNALVIGADEEAQVLPGWRFKRDRLDRGAVNLWFEPTPATMVAADASLTSIANGYSARAAYGWRLHDWFYLGPEAQTFACIGYSQLRFGLHLTGLKTEQWEWSAAAGWANDSDGRSSPNLRLGLLTRR